MFTTLNHSASSPPAPKEGDLYKKVVIADKTFSLYYGYYEEFERASNDPIPIYPDLKKDPVHSAEGIPIVTGMQDPCPHYTGKPHGDSCVSCTHFKSHEELFGLCHCPANRRPPQERPGVPNE